MNHALLLLTTLYAITAVAFIGVLNARGVWRTTVASLLALGCLGAAVWHTQAWRAVRLVAAPPKAVAAPSNTVDVKPPAAPARAAVDGRLVAQARALYDSLVDEAPEEARRLSDSAYQVLDARAQEYVSRAWALRDAVAQTPATGGPTDVALATEALSGAVADLRAFLRAGSRDEEQRLLASFRKRLREADAPLRRAETSLAAP